MEIQLIRNATIKLRYAGHTLLIDPFFGKRGTLPSFAGKAKNPLVDLPFDIPEILKEVDAVLISHLHPDHFDEAAQQSIGEDMKIFCQPGDLSKIQSMGFEHVEAIHEQVIFADLQIIRTPGQHGEGAYLPVMGEVSGFIFKHKDEKTLYWSGDTILCSQVTGSIQLHKPDVMVVHAGGNTFKKEYDVFQMGFREDSGSVIMNEAQVAELCRIVPDCQVVATHIGALDHDTVSREGLKNYATENEINGQLLIPEDGEVIIFD